jgi:hypothetical protein
MGAGGNGKERGKGRGFDRRAFLRASACSLPAFLLARPAAAFGAASAAASTDPHFLRRVVDFHHRSEWTSVPPIEGRLDRARPYYRITVHHAGTGTNHHEDIGRVVSDIHNIMDGHIQRRFGDIGYHFVIDRAGRVWEGRPLCYMGAHVCAENEGNIGVMLLGNFEHQTASSRQVDALHEVVRALREQFRVAGGRIYGHRDLGPTVCPGRYLYGYVDLLRGRRHT